MATIIDLVQHWVLAHRTLCGRTMPALYWNNARLETHETIETQLAFLLMDGLTIVEWLPVRLIRFLISAGRK